MAKEGSAALSHIVDVPVGIENPRRTGLQAGVAAFHLCPGA